MKKLVFGLRLLAAVVTIVSIYVFAPWQTALYWLTPLPDSIQQEIDHAVDEGLVGMMVYVNTKDGPPEFYAGGWFNRETNTPATPHALFKIASIGKLYDAAAVVKLSAAGVLNLDNTLADYLPVHSKHIENAARITLRMMLQHRSGIPNFTDADGFTWGEPITEPLALIIGKPALFEPDTDYAYSNTNYLLLQMIMSQELGYFYWHYIEQELLRPLGLSNTFHSVNAIDTAQLMSGYYVGYQEDVKHLDQGYIATAEDVGIFVRALNEGTFFSDDEMQIYQAVYEFGHTGWVLGYYSIARYHNDIDAVIVQFVNINGGDITWQANVTYDRITDIIRKRDE